MASHSLAVGPFRAATGIAAIAAGLAARNMRVTVVASVVLICGAFAAASALQMRLDRSHAASEARYFEARRAHDAATQAAETLDRIEREARAFAHGALGRGADPLLRNVAIFSPGGALQATMTGSSDFVRLPRDLVLSAKTRRILIGGKGLAAMIVSDGDRLLAAAFETRALAAAAGEDAAILAGGVELQGVAPVAHALGASVPGWPAEVRVAASDANALSAWYGSLPLYLFVIFGPALVGAGLAALFVGEFERRMNAAQAIRALRATPPADARLLLRLAQAERDAAEARRSKAEFVAHMSHELRTPLNAVIGFSEIIERGLFGPVGHPKYSEYARDIGSAGRGLHGRIGDILEFANLEAGRYPIQFARVDLAALAQAVADEQTGRAFSRRIALDVVAQGEVPAVADALAVRRALSLLLANALAYAPEGGRVLIEARAEVAAAVLSVIDNGPGFRPSEKARAGDPFRSFERAGARTGQGLGIAIAMELARRMGGALKLASQPGVGTGVELRLRRG
ncbi:MAG TPA: HAMP domain-containing sensor histidine kinase [Rhizomicrobium sp.]|nr:HAMP domain-containing sensor histidine kinase [Rhizomicrobium sp.]